MRHSVFKDALWRQAPRLQCLIFVVLDLAQVALQPGVQDVLQQQLVSPHDPVLHALRLELQNPTLVTRLEMLTEDCFCRFHSPNSANTPPAETKPFI